MKHLRCLSLTVLAVASAALATATPAALAQTAGRARIAAQNNLAWAGYVDHHNAVTYTSVSADWVQPAASCTGDGSQVALYVGLDGYANGYYEDTGTRVKCPHGIPVYSGWYALYPNGVRTFSNTVSPGDAMTASVMTNSPGVYTTTLTDVTRGWTRIVTKFVAFPIGHSAEALVDDPAPPSHAGTVRLANFGTVELTNVMANGQNMVDPTRMVMERNSGIGLKASITGLLGHTHFSVTWLHRD